MEKRLTRSELIDFNLSLATLGLKYCNVTNTIGHKEDFFKNGTSVFYNKSHYKNYPQRYTQNNNKGKRKKIIKKYYENNKDKYYSWNAERRALENGFYNQLSKKEKLEIKKVYNLRNEMNKGNKLKYEVDHIIPLSKGGKHHASNLEVITMKENRKKYNKI